MLLGMDLMYEPHNVLSSELKTFDRVITPVMKSPRVMMKRKSTRNLNLTEGFSGAMQRVRLNPGGNLTQINETND